MRCHGDPVVTVREVSLSLFLIDELNGMSVRAISPAFRQNMQQCSLPAEQRNGKAVDEHFRISHQDDK